jgi:hypothetical protein
MIIVGGTYIEECKWPESHRLMGSGARAALVISDLSPGSELYTYVDPANRDDLKFTMTKVKPRLRARREPITFYYEHPLTSPPEQQPNKPLPKGPSWAITGDTVLAFPLRECKVLVNADRAVIEISPREDERIERGKIGTLALIAGQDGLPDPSSATAPDLRSRAEGWLIKYDADLIIIRWQAGGGVLFDGKRQWDIPAYVVRNWFKIGAGNVFCAMFAHYWGEQKMDALRAAELASRSSAYYASELAIPMVAEGALPAMETFNPTIECKIFIASPWSSMAQRWLLNQAIDSLDRLGLRTVSAYDLKRRDIEAQLDRCDAVLVLAEGADIASVLAVGLARVRHLPIVVLAEDSKESRLDWQGTDCEIASDFASAIYRAMVAARKRKSRRMAEEEVREIAPSPLPP